MCYRSVEFSSSINQYLGYFRCKLALDMIFAVLCKYLNCADDETIDTGHTTSTGFGTNYNIILLMILLLADACSLKQTHIER